jgi:hypothetical protein
LRAKYDSRLHQVHAYIWKWRFLNKHMSAEPSPLVITQFCILCFCSNMASSSHRTKDQDATINSPPPSISHAPHGDQQQRVPEKQDTVEVELDLQSSTEPSKYEVNTPPSQQSTSWFHWHEPGTSPEEKKLIFKLDWFLLSFSCLCFFVKQLDQNNISNAYVSGMKEDQVSVLVTSSAG